MVKVTEGVIGCRLYKSPIVRGCVIDGSIAIKCSRHKTEGGMLLLLDVNTEIAKLPISTIKDIRLNFDVIIITLKRH